MTKGAPHPEMANEFLKAVVSQEAQVGWALARGGIPPRVDVDVSRFGPIAAQTATDLASAGTIITPGYAVLTSAMFQEAINPALQQFVDPASPNYQNTDAVLAVMKSNYDRIRP
jgi:ABC-type glycerol-3-phosphate transport system substrate-binding protein